MANNRAAKRRRYLRWARYTNATTARQSWPANQGGAAPSPGMTRAHNALERLVRTSSQMWRPLAKKNWVHPDLRGPIEWKDVLLRTDVPLLP